MLKMKRKPIIRSILFILVILSPLLVQSQSRDSDMRKLHREIDRLSATVEKLKAEQTRAYHIESEITSPSGGFTRNDSQRLRSLKRKQAESRARIDQLTQDIIKISKQLEDPSKRYALAKKMQQTKLARTSSNQEAALDSNVTPQVISARAIDLLAVKLVRAGKSLDQARLLTIEALGEQQVRVFYQNLEKVSRYELYDIADEIVLSDKVELVDARRSAIYFYLFTK